MKRITLFHVFFGLTLLLLLAPGQLHIARAADPSPTTIPVIFIPGIGGTRIADNNNVEYWTAAGYSGHDQLTLYPSQPHPTLYPTNAITEATFLGVHLPFEDWQTYGPLFDYFADQGFVQYDTHQDPYLQTSAGCDLTQASNNPNLFVFAYDWRISNAQNAALLADYVACVQKFYPNTNVNLVAHSMGGLVARRYILQYNTNHNVNALVSISTPYLGASKVVWVEETGEFAFFVWASTLFSVVGSFNGASELLNSSYWYSIGGLPALIENGQDLNGNGKYNDQFTYPMLVQYMNTAKGAEGFLPGTQNQNFHSYTNGGNQQDNWSADTTGVKYYHLMGEGLQPDTINQVVAGSFLKCLQNFKICNLSTWMYPKFTQGDVTVPYLSLSRSNGTLNYNAPNAHLYTCQAFGANNQNVDHTGMLSNVVVQDLITGYLTQANGGNAPSEPPGLQCGNGANDPPLEGLAQGAAYHLTLSGVKNVQITDGTSDPIPDGAAQYQVNDNSVVLVLAAEKTYDVTFDLDGTAFYMEGLHKSGKKIMKAERILDQPTQNNAQGKFTVSNGDISALSYDGNNDGQFEKSIPPDVDLSGKAARDARPPKINMERLAEGGVERIVLTAEDKKAGVADIVYSFDGEHFQRYTRPVVAPKNANKLYVFADDKAGNRSLLKTFDLK